MYIEMRENLQSLAEVFCLMDSDCDSTHAFLMLDESSLCSSLVSNEKYTYINYTYEHHVLILFI